MKTLSLRELRAAHSSMVRLYAGNKMLLTLGEENGPAKTLAYYCELWFAAAGARQLSGAILTAEIWEAMP